jgi:hypothetical protein
MRIVWFPTYPCGRAAGGDGVQPASRQATPESVRVRGTRLSIFAIVTSNSG